MCTKPRVIAQDVIYEVTTRCLPELRVFGDETFRDFFLQELRKNLQKYSYSLFSWSIVDNHYHLVLLSSHFSISTFMHRLNTVLAKNYNRINKREGVVLKTRFSSVIVQENNLKELIRHIHLNPVRSGECSLERLNTYKWSGHGDILGNKSEPLINKDKVLSYFSEPNKTEAYESFITSTQNTTGSNQFIKLLREANNGKQSFSNALPWIIGDSQFIQSVLKKDRLRKLRLARHANGNMSLELLRKSIENCMQLSDEELFFKGRLNSRSQARQFFAHIGKMFFDFSCKSIADYLNVSSSSVSKLVWKANGNDKKDAIVSKLCNIEVRAGPIETAIVI
ncbi:transposase [Chitinispirillales bacterium ANBcel5]|uniref:transposase n=1 Tax=Cellulosispirillum alkaliphilum TaxID=3039283 RepID=UPI002A543566|nr:transposase [Chitinispirillales bacterium ANBcel5]